VIYHTIRHRIAYRHATIFFVAIVQSRIVDMPMLESTQRRLSVAALQPWDTVPKVLIALSGMYTNAPNSMKQEYVPTKNANCHTLSVRGEEERQQPLQVLKKPKVLQMTTAAMILVRKRKIPSLSVAMWIQMSFPMSILFDTAKKMMMALYWKILSNSNLTAAFLITSSSGYSGCPLFSWIFDVSAWHKTELRRMDDF
jgi:hypothetical protein